MTALYPVNKYCRKFKPIATQLEKLFIAYAYDKTSDELQTRIDLKIRVIEKRLTFAQKHCLNLNFAIFSSESSTAIV